MLFGLLTYERQKRLIKGSTFRFFRELSKVKDNQRSLVIVTHGFIELLVSQASFCF